MQTIQCNKQHQISEHLNWKQNGLIIETKNEPNNNFLTVYIIIQE